MSETKTKTLNEITSEFKNTFTAVNDTSRPEFYVNTVLDTLNELNEPLDLSLAPEPPLSYFGATNLSKFLKFLDELASIDNIKKTIIDYNKLSESNKELLNGVSEFCANLQGLLTPILSENINSPEYFSMFLIKLNEKLAIRHQKLTREVSFDKTKDEKYKHTFGSLRRDAKKLDTAKVIDFNNNDIKVSICEVTGRKRPTQEDQYHVRQLDIEQQEAPTVLKEILKECEIQAEKVTEDSGSTATLTHLSKSGIITVASVGDAPAMFMAKSKAGEVTMIPLTHDHEPNDFFEKSRIYKNGGSVVRGRVNKDLNLTRAIGDNVYKRKSNGDHISSEPDIVQIDVSNYLNEQYDVCVLTACDGILNHGDANRQNYADLFSLDENLKRDSVFMADIPKKPRTFAERVVDYALNSGSSDNITVLATELNTLPEKDLLLAVFDGHGGKKTSELCEKVVQNWGNN